MTTPFTTLPLISLSALCDPNPDPSSLTSLSASLSHALSTTGFAYLTDLPLTFTHDEIFTLAASFFRLPELTKASLAKRTFVPGNRNTYRGYFPPQPGLQQDNLKEGFEIGPYPPAPSASAGRKHERKAAKFDLAEPNVWPDAQDWQGGRAKVEQLYGELQTLSAQLLSLLAVSLGKPRDFFAGYLDASLSTLRLLHYPPQPRSMHSQRGEEGDEVQLCCTPHTDSGILTLLHQDQTGGLEVRNAAGEWVPAPYVPGSLVINIGDLLARVSGGRFVATMHRVRSSTRGGSGGDGESQEMGRFSVPFFFEPGEGCVVRSVNGGEGVVYGDYVRQKMSTWVEYQDQPEEKEEGKIEADRSVAVAA